MKLPFETPLLSLPGITPTFLSRLKKLGIETVRDLLSHFPTRYEDFSTIYKISDLEPGQHATIQGSIEDIALRRSWRKKMAIVEAVVADESGTIRAVWFNQPYLASTLRPGRIANFAGKVSLSEEGELYLSHPAHELVRRVSGTGYRIPETKHTARLVPIYPETQGLTSKGIRYLIQPILKNAEAQTEWIPKEILEKHSLPEINEALGNIHFPEEISDAELAKKRFSFEDLFLLQLYNLGQKLKLAKEKSRSVKTDIEWLKGIIGKLPFELTQTQKRSLWEIIQDMEKPRPMNRLLQGDVGSGKTVVAALAALTTAKNNLQSAFMAPTEVLVKQHLVTLKKLFSGISADDQPKIGLITSNSAKIFDRNDAESEIKKETLLEKVKNGEIKIVVGTHALISASEQTSVEFEKLGLVIVDEQHRFGVHQRATLTRHNDNTIMTNGKTGRRQESSLSLLPHFLSMSATPIPRTLMMTVFGDLDISIISELPSGRKEITTKVVPPKERSGAYDFIRKHIKSGRQVFVICPRIEANSKEQIANDDKKQPAVSQKQSALWDVKSVKEEYEKLSKKVFPDLKVGMLHGKLKPKEKEKIMNEFRQREIDVLVSTSVIEVGVDIPNATIMMIEGADRFGLAQLYQFRGRVGRGEHQSYCFLLTDSEAKSTHERLGALIDAKNGFELAEYDLKLRGPGEFLGEAQTGMPDYAMRALQDPELVKASRESAVDVIKTDPELENNEGLKIKLAEFKKALHLE